MPAQPAQVCPHDYLVVLRKEIMALLESVQNSRLYVPVAASTHQKYDIINIDVKGNNHHGHRSAVMRVQGTSASRLHVREQSSTGSGSL